jgi:hypothetical protein
MAENHGLDADKESPPRLLTLADLQQGLADLQPLELRK